MFSTKIIAKSVRDLALSLILLSPNCSAGLLRFPLIEKRFGSLGTHEKQQPLQQQAALLDHGSAPLYDVVVLYGIEIALGTPPQIVPVLLDLELDTFWVQDSSCTALYTCKHPSYPEAHNQTYNASASTSFETTGETLMVGYAGVTFMGPLGYDTLVIAGIEIPRQPFLDATDARFPGYFHLYQDGFNGAVTLSPPYANPQRHTPSVWQTLVDRKILDRNVFSITPPTGKREGFQPRTNGELILGAYPEDFNANESIRLPIKEEPGQSYAWATSIESISFGDDIHEKFSNGTAAFSTTDWTWSFPEHLVQAIAEVIIPILDERRGGWFPCESRKALPNLNLGIGGQNLEVNPEQYTYEVEMEDEDGELKDMCIMMLSRRENGTVGLGVPFLQNFVAVFDIDDGAVLLNPIELE